MSIDMLNVSRADGGLSKCRLHRTSCPAAVLRTRCQMMSIGTRTITNQLGQRRCSASKGMLQRLDDEDPGPLGHHKSITIPVKRTRSLLRAVGKTGRQGASRSKTP